MSYLLDTNIVSELRKAGSKNVAPEVLAWAKSTPIANQYISVISVLELELGVLLKEASDPSQGKVLRVWLENNVLTTFAKRTIPVDLEVARVCASLHVPRTRPERDSLIMATALAHRLVVVTRNVEDFKHEEVEVLNPFE